jgi:hypothetical protein
MPAPVPRRGPRPPRGDVGECGVCELLEQPFGLVFVGFQEGCQVPRREVGGEQAQHPERELLILAPAVIAQRERRPDFEVSRPQQVQPPAFIP